MLRYAPWMIGGDARHGTGRSRVGLGGACGAGLIAAALLWLLPAPSANAERIDVPAGDVGALNSAIETANNNGVSEDEIVLEGGTFTLTGVVDFVQGATGLRSVQSEVTIRGNGAVIRRDPSLACQPDGTRDDGEFRILFAAQGGSLRLEDVTLQNGCADGENAFPTEHAPKGGGLLNLGSVSLGNVTIADNAAWLQGGGVFNAGSMNVIESAVVGNEVTVAGGGIGNTGTLTVIRSTLADNLADTGGGLWSGGGESELVVNFSTIAGNEATAGAGLLLRDRASIRNSTISGNRAETLGGGVNNVGTLTIESSTLADNAAGQEGGALRNVSTSSRTGTIEIKNTILSNSLSGGNCHKGTSASINSQGHNLSSDITCISLNRPTDQNNVDPLLEPLADNGGVTQTHALLEGSPAIDAGDCPADRTDQREVAIQGEACDIGAFESEFQPVSPPNPPEPPSPPPGDGSSLRAFDANDNCALDDPELFTVIDQWIGGEISDGLLFEAIDAWILQSDLCVGSAAGEPFRLDAVTALQTPGGGTTFAVRGPSIASLRVDIYDRQGHRVFTGRTTGARLTWNLRASTGRPVANGVYLYAVTATHADGRVHTGEVRKLAILR